jgi:hypothetical protein
MTANKEKRFDCLKMKTDIQAQIYSETQNMTTSEILDYFNKNKSFLPVTHQGCQSPYTFSAQQVKR